MNKSNCKIIIQARVSSTRLSQKTILKFHNDKGILEILIDRIKSSIHSNDIIVATSNNSENDSIVEISKKTNVNCFRGSENDVLKRFIDAADAYNANHILRVCSDNVFLDICDLKRLYDIGMKNPTADYIAYKIDDKPNILTHYGLWGELVSLSALKKINSLTSEPLYHEHVTNFIYNNPKYFNVKWINPIYLPNNKDIRLTTDTLEDFKINKYVYEHLISSTEEKLNPQNVFDFIEKNQKLQNTMKNEILKNEK